MSASQIFAHPIGSSMKEDLEDMKDELLSIKEDSSQDSAKEHRSRFVSPEK